MKLFPTYSNRLQSLVFWLKNIPWILAKQAFLVIVLLVVFDALVGGYLLYKHVISATISEESGSLVVIFKQGAYQSVVKTWDDRKQALESSLKNNYQNPFIK